MRKGQRPRPVVWLVGIASMSFTLGCGADEPPVTAMRGVDPQQVKTTLTGCLRQGEQPGTFLLTAVGTAGTTPVDQSAAEWTVGSGVDRYRLATHEQDIQFAEHVDERVTVEGRIWTPEATAWEAGPKPQGTSGMLAALPTLDVERLRGLDDACAPEQPAAPHPDQQ